MNLSPPGIQSLWQPAETLPPRGYLMVVLHGRGDSVHGFDWLQAKIAIPNLSVLLLNAPDPYYTGFSWYDLPPNQGPGVQRSRSILEKVFDWLESQGIPADRIFLFGFSQGCLMTLEFGARYPKRLAGYLGVSGYCLDEKALIREASPVAIRGDWLITHGTKDEVLEIDRTRSQMKTLQDAGFNLEYLEYPKAHTIDLRRELPHIRQWLQARISTPAPARPAE